MTSASDEKWRPFNCFFQSMEQVVVRWGHIRRIGWVIKILEVQVGQFLLGCKCPVSRGIFVQEQDPLGDLPATFFLQTVLQLYHQRSIISGMVTVLGRPGRGASQVEKSPRLNWAKQFLTVAYDGACSPNVSVRMAWISLDPLPCRKKTCWQLASPCCWNRARRLTCFLQPL